MKYLIIISLLLSTSILNADNRVKLVKPIPENAYSDLVPIYVDPPIWPISALRNGQNGWVHLQFELTGKGRPINVRLVDSSPAKIFDKTAMKSIKKWKFSNPIDYKSDTTYHFVIELKVGDDDNKFNDDVTSLPISEAKISNASIVSVTDEIIRMEFKYDIEPYHVADKVYGCNVLFISKDGPIQTAPMDETKMCFLRNKSGKKIVFAYLPEPEELESVEGNINIAVAILQRIDDAEFKVIGVSKVFRYNPQ